MFVVVVGDPMQGIAIHGTFDTHDEALEWAEIECGDYSWWIADVEPPTRRA